MRLFETLVLENAKDIYLAEQAGALEPNAATDCEECGQELTYPYSVRIDEHDYSVSLCTDCQPVPN